MVFAVLLTISSKSLVGLPLELILVSWFFKYTFILFDHCLRGFDDTPALDINLMNPFSELRPIGMLLIVSGMTSVGWIAFTRVGPGCGLGVWCAFITLLPASIAILGLESNPLKAINPFACLRMVRDLGSFYWSTLGLVAAECVAIYLLSKIPLGLLLQIGCGMFGTFSAFSLLAGALYERRDKLGLIAWASPERREETQRREDHKRDEKTITEAYGLLRSSRHVESWQMLQDWLQSQGFSSSAYKWLTEQADRWEDIRYGTRLAEDWIERLVIQRKSGEALAVLRERLRHYPDFRPKSASDTLQLAELAAYGGGSPRTAKMLLSDFSQRFPADVRISQAAELAQRLQ